MDIVRMEERTWHDYTLGCLTSDYVASCMSDQLEWLGLCEKFEVQAKSSAFINQLRWLVSIFACP